MAVFIFVALVITAIHKFVVEPHLTRTLTECYWAGHADVAHLTAADPRFYCMQIRLTKACMDERGYVFDDIATSEILAARSNAAPAMSLALLAQLEYRLVMEREHWRMRWFWEEGYVSDTWARGTIFMRTAAPSSQPIGIWYSSKGPAFSPDANDGLTSAWQA